MLTSTALLRKANQGIRSFIFMRSLRNKKGITLIASILIVAIASIVVLSTSTFIVEKLSLVKTKSFRIKTMDLAQAGIEAGIFVYRVNDDLPSREAQLWLTQTNMDPNNFFVLGGTDADMLMIDRSTTSIVADKKKDIITDFRLKNATSTRPITIDRLVISWNNNKRLQRVVLNGKKFTGKNQRSPATVDLGNRGFTLNDVPTTYGNNSLTFTGRMAGSTVNINFIMANDASSKDVDVYPPENKFNFTLKSTGRTTGSDIQRTISAQYNSLTSTIEDLHEIDAHLIQ